MPTREIPINEEIVEMMRKARFADDEIIAIGNYVNSLIDVHTKSLMLNINQMVFGPDLKPVEEEPRLPDDFKLEKYDGETEETTEEENE